MLRRMIVVMLLLMLSASSCAEVRYRLEEGWHYTEDGKICRESDGKLYDNIWEGLVLWELSHYDWGYGDEHYMKTSMIEYVADADYDAEPLDGTLPVGISAIADDGTVTWARYRLPEGWHYMDEENDDLRVVAPTGEVYSSIWDSACVNALWKYDKNYGHEPSMRQFLIADETTARYKLPEGWHYMDEENDDLRVVSPTGEVYDNIWVHECLYQLHNIDYRYGEEWTMRELRILEKDAGNGDILRIAAIVGSVTGAAVLAAVLLLKRRKKRKN